MSGTTKLPGTVPQRAYERAEFAKDGGITHCGHDVPENVELGHVFYCPRCSQFLALVDALPWLIKNKWDRQVTYEENHIKCKLFVVVDARITENNYQTITPFPGQEKKLTTKAK